MKINFTEEMQKDSRLSRLILSSISSEVCGIVANKRKNVSREQDYLEVDIVFTIDGHDLDLEKFCEKWDKQADKMIRDRAKLLIKQDLQDKIDSIKDSLDSVNDIISDLQTEVNSVVDSEVSKLMPSLEYARKLWSEFGDIPIDTEECIEQEWLGFAVGSNREAIWHWFEEEFNLSVAEDLMGMEK